jgi:hypothetical protein
VRRRLSKRRIRFAVVVLTGAMVLATPMTAFAEMDAALSSSHARPGDTILLLTDDHKGTSNYKLLSSEDHQRIYLAPTTGNPAEACGGPGSQMVGSLEWRGNAGGVVFVVPSLPFADYWLFMETSGQCWRIAGGTGASSEILVLSIGNTPADNQDTAKRWTVNSLGPPPRPVSQQSRTSPSSSPSALPWLGIVSGCALVLLLISVVWRKARARKPVSD